jgi:hypothetical protein
MSIAGNSSTLTAIHYSNLCAHRWLKQIKTNGTTDEFGAYYMSLAENQRTYGMLFFGPFSSYLINITLSVFFNDR